MILHFRLSVCSLGKIIVIWTILGGRALMSPNGIASFSYGDTNSSSSTTCRTNLVQGTYPTSCMSPDNLCRSA
jgi:hypothetical protein